MSPTSFFVGVWVLVELGGFVRLCCRFDYSKVVLRVHSTTWNRYYLSQQVMHGTRRLNRSLKPSNIESSIRHISRYLAAKDWIERRRSPERRRIYLALSLGYIHTTCIAFRFVSLKIIPYFYQPYGY